MEMLLTTNQLTKVFGQFKAVNAIDINIKQGDIYGLIGRNGAGKTTILKMISGLAKPTSGSFTLFGEKQHPNMAKVGTLIEAPGIYPNMTALNNIKLKCLVVGVNKKGYAEELLKSVGLESAINKKVSAFSLGMKQRLGIALALVGDPELVILDEPINGLDPQGIAEIRDIILKLNKEKKITFIISSHILEELSKIATRYGIIHKGLLIQELTEKELAEKSSKKIELLTDDVQKAVNVLNGMGITNLKTKGDENIEIYECLNECNSIVRELVKNDVTINGISVKNQVLEEYFLNLTGGERND